ncbi:MAG: hypothetical protein HY518_03225 [Candidatus Aenigmarchaeota archaeon]|nr:hypothetical protein [Candidatus Aenigmarchaeota archaeon]
MKKLTGYKNFWLIWISAAGDPAGTSLFKIQKSWGIKTNYLYHNEARLGKPLFKAMVEEGYLSKDGKKLLPKFEWIPGYIIEKFRLPREDGWSSSTNVIEKWPAVQSLIEKYPNVLLSGDAIKALYRNEIESIRKCGHSIFADIYLFVFFANLIPFCRKYGADIVIRMLYTIASLEPDRSLLAYFRKLEEDTARISNFPAIIKDEADLMRILTPIVQNRKVQP